MPPRSMTPPSSPSIDDEAPATPSRKRGAIDDGDDDDDTRDQKRAAIAPQPHVGGPVEVTPAVHRKRRATDSGHATAGSINRSLFPNQTAQGAATITPSKSSTQSLPEGRRKLIFGKSVIEVAIKQSVKDVYKLVQKLTGSIGGNGAFGPIYGELTMGSMQKMINLMKEHAEFDASSRFIDVGSGIGKPNLHVAQDPGVNFSYGIEVEESRWLLGMNCLKAMLNAAKDQDGNVALDKQINHRCIFVKGDIRSARCFDPFSHVYMFSIGFPPDLWVELSAMWNKSHANYLICYHGPKDIVREYAFDAELVVQTPTSMHGSKEGHMGYIYRRVCVSGSKTKRNAINSCDPYFQGAWDTVQKGFQCLKDNVDTTVDSHMQPGSSTRSTRKSSHRM